MYLAQWSNRIVMYLLASASLRVLVLAAWAALVVWILRRRGPETRHAVWVVVLVAMLGMPVLTVVVPRHRVVPPSWLVAPPRVPSESALRVQSPTVMTVTASGETTVNESAVPVRRPVLPNWPSLLMAAYGLIVALGALRVALAVRRAAGLVRESEEIRDERLTERLRLICLEQGTGYPLPAVRQSNSTQVPFTAGWQAPAILLPPDWREWDAFKLKAVLAHEMAHIRRGDWLIALLAAVNRTLFWFHPLAWWLERRLADLAEEACDTAAIGPQGDARRYASVVLEFATTMASVRPRLSWEATAMARSSRIGGRIERIMEGRMSWSKSMTKPGWALLLVLSLPVMYSASALQPIQPPQLPASSFGPLPPASVVVAGGDMTAAEAAMLEDRVARNSRDLDARQLLTGYYYRHASVDQYRQQLLWMAENAPESDAHNTSAFAAGSNGSLMVDEATKGQLTELWQKQAARHPADPAVLVHAARFFLDDDPEAALPFYLRAREVAPENNLCVEELVTLHARSVWIGEGPNQLPPETRARAERIRAALENSNDAEVVGRSALRLGPYAHQPLEKAPAAIREMIEERNRQRGILARRLLERAHALAPADERWVRALARLDRGELVQEQPGQPEKPVSSSPAVYPPLAKLARLQGNVMLQVSVDSDGSVSDATLMSGHPLLARAALEAVRSWKFASRPAGQRITTMVEFRLPEDRVSQAAASAPPVQAGSMTTSGVPVRIAVGGNVQKAQLIESPEPVYPPLARQARISGIVRFNIIIGKDGSVVSVTLVSGHPLLIQAGKEVVSGYRYKPMLLNGNPVEVATTVDVPFTLPN